MNIYIYYLITMAIFLLPAACTNEPIFDDKEITPEKERTISLTAAMPNDGPTMRVALSQEDDLSVSLKWEEGDQLQLVFVQDDIKIKDTFDLYGVYGGGGLSDEDPTIAIMPVEAGETGTLASIEENEQVMFYFDSKDMNLGYSEPSVIFKNFGSLFSINLNNTGSTSFEDIAEARLIGVDGDDKWAYNIGEGGGS